MEVTEDGESTEKWAARQPGFMGSIKQLTLCARCGADLPGGKNVKRRVYDLFRPTMHFICEKCHAELPD